MSFEKKIIVPGIIVYNVGLETSKNLIDSIEGFVGDRWEPGAIVNVNEKGKGEVDMQHRKCGTYGIPNGFFTSSHATRHAHRDRLRTCLGRTQRSFAMGRLAS